MAVDGSFSLHSSLRRLLDRCPKLQCFPQFESLARRGDLVTEEEVVNVLVGVFLHPSYTIPLMGCFRPIAQSIVDKAVALLGLVPNLRSIPEGTACEDDPDRVLDGVVETQELHITRISYRFLLMEPEIFTKLWDWSCFIDLVKDPCKSDLTWCGVQILSVLLKLGYKATENLNLGAEEAFSCVLRWEEFCQDTSLEKAGWYVEPTDYVSSSPDRTMDLDNENCLKSSGFIHLPVSSPKFHELQPHLKRQRLSTRDDVSVSNTFVLTSMVKKSYDRVLLAISQKWPVLLYGPSGSGKSALISKLAQDSGNQVLSIQMDDQIDGRTLVGAYVCTDRPGEFRWQPGSLTQAVQNGLWIVFEDINKAPSDLHSILVPLLEGAGSFATGHGEVVRVAESFRMFSTISASKFDTSESAGQNSLSVFWRRVMIPPLDNKDLKEILKVRYPDLELHVGQLIETFGRVNSISMHQFAGFHQGSSTSVYRTCRFSLRDLLKWCKRIASLGFCLDGSLTENQCFSVYKEAVDIFASFSSSIKNRLSVMKEIAELWKLPVSAAETLYPFDKPIIQDSIRYLRIGRVSLQYTEKPLHQHKRPFVEIRSSLHVLERIACSVKYNEPVLLVGETGTGKTTIVQNLASRLGQKLTVFNLSQQSDVADLLGGFKPMDAQSVYLSLYTEFKELFTKTFSVKNNAEFITYLHEYLESHRKKFLVDKNGEDLLKGLQIAVGKSVKLIQPGSSRKRRRPLEEKIIQSWERFCIKLHNVCQKNPSSTMMFSFVEGSFVTALRKGEWILLDEVNLAPPETLQRIVGVLEGEHGVLCLAERGDTDYIHRHPNFRIFACMNPATDAGKRDLPFSLRSRFTEYFVDDVLNDEDLRLFISQFISSGYMDQQLVNKIVCFYKEAKKESEERLQDSANQKPQYSLRSLYRALEYTRKAERKFGLPKALYDGFSMFFVSLLDAPSAEIMRQKISSLLLGGHMPPHVHFTHYLDTSKSDGYSGNYVQTKTVQEHLGNLARAVLMRYPILLQGPTSSGKTSLVQFLAAITGHDFVRINNHEHTDLQEYLGSYITDISGKLVFNEGVLVKAVRNGHWIVLDELNLAPSDVLEALNRLLDDNRELFVPELQERIQAHPNFMLFATQNPPTLYGGRKMLSRAFRNRFVEIHVGEIPDHELSKILADRCKIYVGHAEKMVEVMKDLRLHRQSSRVFAGKHGFITPRDLFRWADRFQKFGNTYEDLAKDGYYLLAERLRDEDEKSVVQEILEKHFRVKLNIKELYEQMLCRSNSSSNLFVGSGGSDSLESVLLTKGMQRLYFLVERCYNLREPVLLVGETGGGKTTVCQLLSACLQLKLHTLNCHQYTETSDFIGGFRPIRERSTLISRYKEIIEKLKKLKTCTYFPSDLSSDINAASSTLDMLNGMIRKCKEGHVCSLEVSRKDLNALEQIKLDLNGLHQKWQSIFVWQDGPLIEAMRDGDLFLVDEISLADDSVLERLNSVLEPERMLSLAEKGGTDLEKITAHSNFFVLATMNPGGDYGKKELSPALRNRFTEIWVPPVNDLDELQGIALKRISKFKVEGNSCPAYQETLSLIVNAMICFFEWFNNLHPGRMLTVRDLISWVDFFIAMEKSLGPEHALLHGVFLVLLDGLSLGTGLSKTDAAELRERCLSFLLQKLRLQMEVDESNLLYSRLSRMGNYSWAEFGCTMNVAHSNNTQHGDLFGIDPFYINKGIGAVEDGGFEFMAPTTCRNALRVLRAMQLPKPVLLEGSPGVGKTSLIIALGKCSGHRVVRVNFSEQTDMMDLLGSDLPVESDEGMKFSWSDGILLQVDCLALKEGCWILLDELNLAPQSVLEGLNAILDHRAEVFIPELGNTFKCPPSFRVFACQNPSHQGGGRKGLPKSFLNRFTKVYVDELVEEDYLSICESKFATIPRPLLSKLILFNKRMHEDTTVNQKFAKDGFPWEFNLRDVFRSCEIIKGAPKHSELYSFLNIVYIQRMRTVADRKEVIKVFKEVFELLMLPEIRQSLEAAAQCVEHQWLCILTGPSCSGKTSMIRLLANLTGNVLNEINLSAATDISELLGSFEQYDGLRNFFNVVAQIERYVNEYICLQLEASNDAILRETDFYNRWIAFLSAFKFDSLPSSATNYLENQNKIELDLAMKTVLKMKADDQKRAVSTKFEWVTGLLIKAIEQGEWIVLENANLCNPTVLDRINSLVEPCGSITVNERGAVDGKPLVIHPHPNFRMFLTVNPQYGEVSRAMRNRGVEIFMLQPYWALDDKSGYNGEDIELKDARRFLVLSGIPSAELVDSMARAHIYAKKEGLKLNDHITYLELSHWVHLFLQLLRNGCRPIWSLQISWEHIYLSSLGVEGEKIIDFAKTEFLSVTNLSGYDVLTACPLSLPGGWPLPLSLREYIYYSKEASIKQNCMYLESLGTQIASHQYKVARKRHSTASLQTCSDHVRAYMMDLMTLRELMFPKASNVRISDFERECKFDFELANKMLLFAANWTIEQATESDFKLYLLRFKWFSSQLQPFCQFFNNFAILIEQMMKHPIWEYISCRDQLDVDLQLMPLLSLDIVNLAPSNIKIKYLSNAISCFDPLRLTFQQRIIESQHSFDEEASCFIPLLKSLHVLQDEILYKFVLSAPKLIEDQSFDYKIQLYSNLIENHALFWRYFISLKFDQMIISWHSLVKDAQKFIDICPKAVDNFMMESKKLKKFSFSEKSLLWIHGGHPFLPSSSRLHDQQHQLLKFVETIWPRKTGFRYQEYSGILSSHLIDVVASFDHDLRFLVMQDVSNSSFLMVNWSHEDGIHTVQKLEETHQVLLRRFEHEKHKLQLNTGSKDASAFAENSAACCSFAPEMLCQKSAFEAWQNTFLPVDYTSLFWDMEILQKLTSIHLDDLEGLHQEKRWDRMMKHPWGREESVMMNGKRLGEGHAVGSLSNLLDFSLKFSLNFSSRPPQMFVPHQKILWTLNAWASVDTVNLKLASFILEMWFMWHESMWISFLKQNFAKVEGLDTTGLPHMLTEPFSASTVLQITQSTHAIKEFWVQCLKCRVTLFNLWHCSHHGTHLPNFLLYAARSLFQQIIYAHRKSFDADQFSRIESSFSSLEKNALTEESIYLLSSLITSSRHQMLKTSVQKFIVPLLRELYLQSNAADFNFTIGCAWAHIGALRIHLLLSCNEIDPAMKYYCKYSQLMETISTLELEIQVRKECGYFAGQFLTREADKRKTQRMEKLQAECRKLEKKIVFRAEPWKYKKLMNECDDFLKLVDGLEALARRGTAEELQQIVDHACSWQETATCFIDRLMDEYAAYSDIIQPIQVAVYEMKFGLSMILSSTLEKKCLNTLGQENINVVMEMLYTLMRFPRAASCKFISVKHDIGSVMHPSYSLEPATGFCLVDVDLMERLVRLSSGVAADKMVSVVQCRAAVYWNILVQIAHCTANAKIIDDKSYMLLHKIFDEFARLWMSTKVYAKSKSDFDAQQYKFKPRAFQIESVIEVELPTLANSCAPETFLEWKEFSSDENSADKMVSSEECFTLDEEWKQLEASILSHVVLIHNQIFGSSDLVQTPGIFEVSDDDRLHSFIESYSLGMDLIRGVHSTNLPSLDAKLMPEHLFYLCLDYRKKYLLSHKSATRYNFYKDSNAPELVQMLKVLGPLQQQILPHINEWEVNNDLQKILDVIDMLLTLPSDTPLAKAFSGLQFLLHKVQVMLENGSKSLLSSQLKSVYDLLSSWQKMELDSWPALLDEVMDQFENNAVKNFDESGDVFGTEVVDLYLITDSSKHDISSIEQKDPCDVVVQSCLGRHMTQPHCVLLFLNSCLEDFIHTSSIGEFRKRLQLLFAFLVLTKYIDSSRKEVGVELNKLVKLCRWEHGKSHLSIESLKKSRQKLRKLIQKYTDILQEPVSIFLNQEAAQRGAKAQSFHDHKPIYDGLSKGSVDGYFDLELFSENRFMWFDNCDKGLNSALQNLLLKKTSVLDVVPLHPKDIQSLFRPCGDSQRTLYLKGWNAVWHMIEKIYITAVDYGNLWKEEKKGQGKRRALSELLKLLESNGLSRHKSAYTVDQHKTWWFLQLSGNISHVLLTNSRLQCVTPGIPEDENKNNQEESLLMEWKTAIDNYYKSVVSVLLMQQICLNPHKDITLDQVDSSSSFLNQLVQMQQKQLTAASAFDKQLKCLRECQLFDTLYATSQEELLLLRILESSHLNTCHRARPVESLDCYLIGRSKAVTAVTSSSHLCIVNQEMEQLVYENFKTIRDFKDNFHELQEQDLDRSTVREVLIQHFQEITDKAKLIEEEFTTAIKGNFNQADLSEDTFCERNSVELNARFNEALMSTYQHLASVLQNLCSPSNIPVVDESMVKIVSWESLFDSFVTNLSLDTLCENLFKAVSFGEKLVSITTHVIANILASLFSNGFGISPEDQEEDGTLNTTGDASGTGMGEGVGLKDVSDQIADEDQLLGTREQQNEKQDDSDKVPSSNNTGIEMEQDFQADAMSLSEDSEDVDDEDEDGELESEMGPTGPDSEAVGEKVCDKNEDETPNDKREKYESGPSVKDRDEGNRELRAKDDSTTNEPGDGNCDEGDAQDDETVLPDDIGDGEKGDEVTMDKEAAYSDPTGLKPDELDQTSDVDMDLDLNEDADLMEDVEPDEQDNISENGNEGKQDEETCSPDEAMEEAHTEVDTNSEKDDQGLDHNQNADMHSTETNKDSSKSSVLINEQVPPAKLASQSNVDWQTSGSEHVAAESNLSNSHHDFDSTLLGGLPSCSISEMDFKMSDSSNSGGFGENQPKSQHPRNEHSFIQEKHTNPHRSIGDALEYQKERINVSGDLPEDSSAKQDEMEDDNADEYGYVSEFEKGTTQALGPATLEQVDRNIDGDQLDKECTAGEDLKLQFEKEKSEMNSVSISSSITKNDKREQVNPSAMETSRDDGSAHPLTRIDIDLENRLEDLVSIRSSYMSESTDLSQLSLHDKDLGKGQDPSDVPDHVKDNATALWSRFELSTTKLSFELAEQLRLVMEPTLASKLQGDYRTGKRINMKKLTIFFLKKTQVIPYIASDYSKDRIWLRRTRPNKRDYQVVIAVDDSHSMSENGCGDVAIEALVTVCRAVSQLEMGSLAVASFGTKGNIKLLHDFDRPFSGEAGVKMISNLTFEQENTIADEPVVDLLKYLTNKLDTAVVKARLPSGHNPLQQLVLIIADGRFHEKENLKRCVRDVSTGNRMVAFLLLDNSQESIMDLKEASFEGGKMKFSKYMDSFPFPYYIVLRNIEALPRTLANLLRQWMELMQHSTG
ncbi:unnamed protein product [Sphenostylis stenocarpa]|uniref:Midasin n=1 Tax=Sphenostylis stenocarpa TaxID=92480 RepID=A0AA86VYE3_9FABA|nr:unnamed protein product [Sphenostylis stenocarpa]